MLFTNAKELHARLRHFLDAAADGMVVFVTSRKNKKPRAVLVSVEAATKAGLIGEESDGNG